jgi:hypothetical protein
MSYIDQPHIREWMKRKESQLLDSCNAKKLHEYLESLDWVPSRIDWSKQEHLFVPIGDDGDVDMAALLQTPIGCHDYVMVTYKTEDMAILCRTQDAFKDADLLYMQAPGPRYMCGARLDNERVVPAVEDFAEYDLPGFTVCL